MDRIGKYQILSTIGQGGMGVVYKALDPKIDRVLAIKTLSARLGAGPELRDRFRQEARSAARLSHPNIVTIYDYDEEDGVAYLAMEFLDGEDLRTKISRQEDMSLESRIRIMSEACGALAYAHRAGIVHRDVKPGNIFVTRAGEVKILDFGLARVTDSDLTRSGVSMGTPSYMSPEQLRGEKVDARSDIFSAGIVFYELLTFARPFHGDSDFAVSLKIVQAEAEPLQAHDASMPMELVEIIQRALAKDPEARYQKMEELVADLESARQRLGERCRSLTLEADREAAAAHQLLEQSRDVLGEIAALQWVEQGSSGDYRSLVKRLERVRLELGRLTQLRDVRRAALVFLEEAKRLSESGQLALALAAVEKALAAEPSWERAQAVQTEVQERIARRRQEVDAAARADQPEDRTLVEDSEELALRVAEERIRAQRAARIATLEESARLCLGSGNHEEALAAVDEWLVLDPGNDAALELRSRTAAALEARLREIEHRKQGEEAKATGLALLAKGDFRASLDALERAREFLGDQTVIRVAMEEAATGLRAESVRRQRREEARPLPAKAAADSVPSVRDSPQSLIPSPHIRKPDAATLTRSPYPVAGVPRPSRTPLAWARYAVILVVVLGGGILALRMLSNRPDSGGAPDQAGASALPEADSAASVAVMPNSKRGGAQAVVPPSQQRPPVSDRKPVTAPSPASPARSVPQSAAVPSGSPTTTGLEISAPLAETPPPAEPAHTAGTQAADVKIPESRSTPEEHQEAAPASPKREGAENPPLMRPRENLAASAPSRPNPFRTTPPSLDREVMSRRNRGEQLPTFPAQHSHAMGSCSGVLMLGAGYLEFKPEDGKHGLRLPVAGMRWQTTKNRLAVWEDGTRRHEYKLDNESSMRALVAAIGVAP